jgi:eukaryotic-like serine/threonine-protein kinase
MTTAIPIRMRTCPKCGAELGSDDYASLCPNCLILGAFDSSVNAEAAGTQTVEIKGAGTGDDDFGRYRILQVLGEGGMGSVYLAEQLQPIHRRVALKVVKVGMETSQVLARFDNERQALAIMDHTNIARIFDAGATAKGRPYFVMEYIEGLPITAYCDRQRMTTKDRLALFLGVCRAVEHAHQKGVIHRDLKPSNVMVTEQHGAMVPKVIDFGIAKATDKLAVENTLLTQFGQIVGTPEYASPEQADTMTGTVDEGSDVYSLGVILYELLVGAVPFDSAMLRNAGLAEMLRIIREDEAPSLPQKITSMGAAASDVAMRRQTDPASLRRQVDGDLNSMTMKALEKTRERRYASVSDLAADIERYLEDRPVLASSQGGVYRTLKFVRRHRLAAAGVAVALGLMILSAAAAWSFSRRDFAARPKLTEKDTIVIADFENKTGDPVFDDTLRQGLSVDLQQSPFLNVIPESVVEKTLGLMGHPKEARLTPETARQVCERTASAVVLEGSIANLGSQYVLGLSATNCATGNVLDREQAVANRREDVLEALSKLAQRFRTRAGESLATIEKHSTPLAEATTTSLEALKVYSSAMKVVVSSGPGAAMPLFRRAIEIDPKFALAYAQLGVQYSTLGESQLSVDSTTKAWRLRDRVSDRERFFIDFTYDRQVTGNLEKAYQTLELWYRTYPRGENPNAQGFLGGLATHGTGRYERAIEMAQKRIATEPDEVLGYTSLAGSYFFLGRFQEAEEALQGASRRKLESPNVHVFRYIMAALKDDREQMDREVEQSRGKRRAEPWLAHEEAVALARLGRLQAARRSSGRAADLSLQQGDRETSAAYLAARGMWEAIYGNAAEGRKNAVAALELSNGRDAEYIAALALAFSGQSPRSQQLTDDLEKRFPEDTFAKFTYVPVLRALSALEHGRPAESLERLEITRPYELAVNGLNFGHFYLGGLHSAYVRGEALLAERQYAEAATEFQKILDHRGLTGLDPIGALAHLQLGRVFSRSGDTAKAKLAYEAFFALWKDADPVMPILNSAKAEYAKL